MTPDYIETIERNGYRLPARADKPFTLKEYIVEGGRAVSVLAAVLIIGLAMTLWT